MTTEREAVLEAQVSQLNAELVSRAIPRLAELIDSVNNMASLARKGQPGARQVLGDFFRALDEARAASSGIALVTNGAPHV